MVNDKQCVFCKNYNFELKKCEEKECSLIGRNAYSLYEEVNENEKELRLKTIEENNRKEKKEKIIYTIIIFFISLVVLAFLICLFTMLIQSTIYRYSNPSLTETQLFIWRLNNYPFIYFIIILLGLICAYLKLK